MTPVTSDCVPAGASGLVKYGSNVSPMAASICTTGRQDDIASDRLLSYRIQPHFIDVGSILLLGKLYTPFSACFICFVFPSRNNTLLFLM
jgi:hypothetical protein